jgi:hypothetical protein
MNYPYAVATANRVIAAALEWDDAQTNGDLGYLIRKEAALVAAVAAHRDALDRPQGESPRNPTS